MCRFLTSALRTTEFGKWDSRVTVWPGPWPPLATTKSKPSRLSLVNPCMKSSLAVIISKLLGMYSQIFIEVGTSTPRLSKQVFPKSGMPLDLIKAHQEIGAFLVMVLDSK